MKRSAVWRVGGISADTLAEDTDLTLSFHRAGYRVVYTSDAIAWTEAPETLAALAKQRFRWAFGTLQCLWKHRDLVFNAKQGALGWFSLPGIWFFHIMLVAIGPILDGVLIASLLLGFGGAILPYLATFLLADVFLAGLACHLEKEPLWKSLLMIPMRFIYRPLLGWVIWKALFRAVQGAWVNWGKLDRTASVRVRV
jgi:cellulose synthase/poly-beta-1,6-N-acetylglucosamine synthase-like glycosyltransferase